MASLHKQIGLSLSKVAATTVKVNSQRLYPRRHRDARARKVEKTTGVLRCVGVAHRPVLYPDTVVSQTTNRCSLKFLKCTRASLKRGNQLHKIVDLRPARAVLSRSRHGSHHSERRPAHMCSHRPLLCSCIAKAVQPLGKVLSAVPRPAGAALRLVLQGSQDHRCGQRFFIVLVRLQARQPAPQQRMIETCVEERTYRARVATVPQRHFVIWSMAGGRVEV